MAKVEMPWRLAAAGGLIITTSFLAGIGVYDTINRSLTQPPTPAIRQGPSLLECPDGKYRRYRNGKSTCELYDPTPETIIPKPTMTWEELEDLINTPTPRPWYDEWITRP